MRMIQAWPGSVDLGLPDALRVQLLKALISPFPTEDEARRFWDDYGASLIILDPADDPTSEAGALGPLSQSVEMALLYPDFTESLGTTHIITVAIINDAGAGLYVLCPVNHPLLPEEVPDA